MNFVEEYRKFIKTVRVRTYHEGSEIFYAPDVEDMLSAMAELIKKENEEHDQFVLHLREKISEKDEFAIAFAVWLKGPEGKMYEATGMSAYALLEKYKDRPYINMEPNNQ